MSTVKRPHFARLHIVTIVDEIRAMVPDVIQDPYERKAAADFGSRIYDNERAAGASVEAARAAVLRYFQELQEDVGAQFGMGERDDDHERQP